MTDLADSKREIPRSAQPVELGRLECHDSLLRGVLGLSARPSPTLEPNYGSVDGGYQLLTAPLLLGATICRGDAPTGRFVPRRSSWRAAACRHTRARRRARPSRPEWPRTPRSRTPSREASPVR